MQPSTLHQHVYVCTDCCAGQVCAILQRFVSRPSACNADEARAASQAKAVIQTRLIQEAKVAADFNAAAKAKAAATAQSSASDKAAADAASFSQTIAILQNLNLHAHVPAFV